MYVMAIYLVLSIYLMLKLATKNKIPKTVDYVIAGFLCLLFLFRYNLGVDFNIYYGSFVDITNPIGDALHFHMHRNVGFNLIIYLCKVLFGEYRYFVFVSNLILLLLCGYPIVKYSKDIVLSIAIFIGSGILEVYYGSGLRQMYAMAFFFFAYYVFLQHKKYVWYEVMCLIGLSFHETILPVLFLPLLYQHIDWIRKNQLKVLMVGLIGAFAVLLFTSFVLPPFAQQILPTLPPFWHMLYYFAEANKISAIGLLMELVFLIVITGIYHFAQKENDDFEYFGVIVIWLSVIIYIAFCTHSITSRVSDFLQIIFLILIPNLIDRIPKFQHKALSLLVVLCLNGYLLQADLTFKINRMEETFHFGFSYLDYPYVTVFEKEKCDSYIEILLNE